MLHLQIMSKLFDLTQLDSNKGVEPSQRWTKETDKKGLML